MVQEFPHINQGLPNIRGSKNPPLKTQGLVGDAAAVPCHWCYDPAKLAEHLASAKAGPAFCDPPGNVFYTVPIGGFSCYGNQTMELLESLVECSFADVGKWENGDVF